MQKIENQTECRHIPVILISANTSGLKLWENLLGKRRMKKPFNLSAFPDLMTAGRYRSLKDY